MTEPLPTDPLINEATLAIWAEEYAGLERPEFANLVIEAVSVAIRQYGSALWTAANIPPRARDIAYILAKDYYLNPRQLRQETTGPLQESLDASVLNGITPTEAQQAELAALAAGAPIGQNDGIWIMGFTRGPVETGRHTRSSNEILWDTRGAWPIEYLTPEDADAITPEVV